MVLLLSWNMTIAGIFHNKHGADQILGIVSWIVGGLLDMKAKEATVIVEVLWRSAHAAAPERYANMEYTFLVTSLDMKHPKATKFRIAISQKCAAVEKKRLGLPEAKKTCICLLGPNLCLL